MPTPLEPAPGFGANASSPLLETLILPAETLTPAQGRFRVPKANHGFPSEHFLTESKESSMALRSAKFVLAFMAVFVAAALAACGSGGGSSGPAALAPVPNNPLSGNRQAAGPATAWKAQVGAERTDSAFQGLRHYPQNWTINVGDSISWRFNADEPHTVSFLAPGQPLPPPNSPIVSKPAGGSTEDGSEFTSSGFMFTGGTYTLTFTKAGTYTFYCLIHQPEMRGTVVVHAAGTPYPQAPAPSPSTPGGTHLPAGITPGLLSKPPSHATVLRFLDGPSLNAQDVSIPVGATLTWTDESNNEPHTVTFPAAGHGPPNLPPFAPPSGPDSYDGTQLVNSGVLFPGGSFSLKFTKAGTFTYFCLFHDNTGMFAKVTVH